MLIEWAILRKLNWLPIWNRISYKIATITYCKRNCQQPGYLLVSLISYKLARTPCSSSSNLLTEPHRLKTVTLSRAFHVEPTIWNNLRDFVKVANSFNVLSIVQNVICATQPLNSRLFQPASLYCRLTSSELQRRRSIQLYCTVLYCFNQWHQTSQLVVFGKINRAVCTSKDNLNRLAM